MAVIHAVGDHALVEDVAGELRLVSARGPVWSWRIHEELARVPEERFEGAIAGFLHMAAPPRLALLRMSGLRSNMRVSQVDATWIELIDIATGEVQRRVDVDGLVSLVGFAPGGGGLFANRGAPRGAVRVDDGGGVRNLDVGPRVLTACCSHAPELFAAWSSSELFALDAEGRIVASVRRENLCGAVLGESGRSAILVEHGGGAHAVLSRFAEWDLASGRSTSDTVTVERKGNHALLRSAQASRNLERVAIVDEEGNLSSFLHRRGRGWAVTRAALTRDILVDVDNDRVLQEGLGAYLRTTAGALLKTAGKATKWCFAGVGNRGPACVLVGGAVHVLDETGTHIVDGPGDLVDVGAHPRGVIAVDVRDRAHVVEVDV